MFNRVAAFVPLKLNSRRLPNKNFLRLGDRPLAYHIFETLATIEEIQQVLCYTSQPQVLNLLPNDVELLMRPRNLDADSVKANELFHYAVSKIDAEVIVLCHATGPFVKSRSIREGVRAVASGEFDCAFAVQRHQTYCWYQGMPLNYNPENMSQTQYLPPIFTETSGFYVFRKEDYLRNGTRIGKDPYMVEVDFKESVDIDNPADFTLADLLIDYEPTNNNYSKDQFFVDIANNSVLYKNIQHISFDMDGVLVDSLAVMELAWKEAMSAVKGDIPFSEYKKNIGIPFFEILQRLGCRSEQLDHISEIYNLVSRKNYRDIRVFDDIADSLARIRAAGLKVSVVTSKNRDRTLELLEQLFPTIKFDAVVTPEDVAEGRGKPCPDPLLLACLKVGADPFNTIYVGDMEVDRESAQRAGIHFVHANWGYSSLNSVKDVWFDNCKDMVDFILE
ncbi:HAD hydrolase-like protein [Ectothiorhodospira lacustris]|uniref:HAD hydrolase-like protein n=1 Tax=Ectothiorhodospira lacustris TaxID=2899127 RepID=UPI001EE8C1AC|nr:HAD hydrolase-like protein [Ectothiorhodospira lacustris]MCG5510656.1 HAD hydrolase-like protein [Ectothiorhodospira lacustris]MCG5522444.1 HAD hydrolase-like protein [Ectothiorhodospira lacustris]